MIQRIQTVFLLASFCFLAPLFFVPSVELEAGGTFYYFDLTGLFLTGSEGVRTIDRQYPLMLFGVLICLLNIVTVFLYRRRTLQMRLCRYNIILIIGLVGVCLYIVRMSPHDAVYFHLPVVFPAIAVILHWLAFRGIRKDELKCTLSRLR
ncbi:MAG: DUF4293 domain-containing protein [Bacteroidales bacterium]|jgi:hypothetical protein|nr:DUF4293 domain-containing protein [Bacteroidales bacterium]